MLKKFPELNELVEKIEKAFIKKNWTNWNPNNLGVEYTKRIYGIFRKIGKQYKYEIWETSKEYYQFMTIDQVWADEGDDIDGIPIVAIESENIKPGFKEVWNDEFIKLLSFNGKYRILIYYCKDLDKVKEDDFKKFNKHFQNHPFIPKGDILIIITASGTDFNGWRIGICERGKKYGKTWEFMEKENEEKFCLD